MPPIRLPRSVAWIILGTLAAGCGPLVLTGQSALLAATMTA
jgi:hypothetical protein